MAHRRVADLERNQARGYADGVDALHRPMETILLAILTLLVVGVLALLWRMQKRVEVLQEKIGGLASLDFVPDRLQALARQVETLDLDPVCASLERVVERVQRVEDLASTATAIPSAPPERKQIVRALIVRNLRDEGYEAIRILSPEADLDAEKVVVQVQAVRRGVSCNGTVEVDHEALGGIQLEPSYSAFP